MAEGSADRTTPAFRFRSSEGMCEIAMQLKEVPGLPDIRLHLMPDGFEKHKVAAAILESLVQAPPYWAFCWGGGLALAAYIQTHPSLASGRVIVDFGAGSGVAGLAAARAGANLVHAIDIDPEAGVAVAANFAANGLASPEFSVSGDFLLKEGRAVDALLLAADICYEEDGRHFLRRWIAAGGHAVVAETRVDLQALGIPGLRSCGVMEAKTYPDLAEDERYHRVMLYSTHL